MVSQRQNIVAPDIGNPHSLMKLCSSRGQHSYGVSPQSCGMSPCGPVMSRQGMQQHASFTLAPTLPPRPGQLPPPSNVQLVQSPHTARMNPTLQHQQQQASISYASPALSTCSSYLGSHASPRLLSDAVCEINSLQRTQPTQPVYNARNAHSFSSDIHCSPAPGDASAAAMPLLESGHKHMSAPVHLARCSSHSMASASRQMDVPGLQGSSLHKQFSLQHSIASTPQAAPARLGGVDPAHSGSTSLLSQHRVGTIRQLTSASSTSSHQDPSSICNLSGMFAGASLAQSPPVASAVPLMSAHLYKGYPRQVMSASQAPPNSSAAIGSTQVAASGSDASAQAPPLQLAGPVQQATSNAKPGQKSSAESECVHQRAAPAAANAALAQPVPLTPGQVLARHTQHLTLFEQSEVLQYQQVYYFGGGARKHPAHPHRSELNHGFDDDRGDYQPVMHDHLGYRYEILSILGKGSFGQVLKVFDHKHHQFRAVKIIRNKQRFHHQAAVEIKILAQLVQKDPTSKHATIKMLDSFYFRNHLCIVFELLHINLYEFIRASDFQGLNMILVQRFAIQLLQSLRFLREEGIIHCDLKPENILLRNNHSSHIKVIDFGSSCYRSERMYTYIQSRFYRSPEVILGRSYSHPIDVWSLGCILCELCTGRAMFPGENEQNQILLIMEVLGYPPAHMSSHLKQASRHSGRVQVDADGMPRLVPNSHGYVPRPGSKSLASVLGNAPPLFVSLVSAMLRWDPQERISPQDALNHPWMTQEAARHQQEAADWVEQVRAAAVQQQQQQQLSSRMRMPLSEAGNLMPNQFESSKGAIKGWHGKVV